MVDWDNANKLCLIVVPIHNIGLLARVVEDERRHGNTSRRRQRRRTSSQQFFEALPPTQDVRNLTRALPISLFGKIAPVIKHQNLAYYTPNKTVLRYSILKYGSPLKCF